VTDIDIKKAHISVSFLKFWWPGPESNWRHADFQHKSLI